MIIETKTRSIIKAVTWRFCATLTTIFLVYIVFGKIELAVLIGGGETVLKILFYFLHERVWEKISFGKRQVEPFVLWFTGLPLSGKTTIANIVFDHLKKNTKMELEKIDSHEVRGLFPRAGYEREQRKTHLRRVAHLINTLQTNGISVIAAFVSPYRDIRKDIREMTKNFIEIYVKADPTSCKERDYKGLWQKAISGKIKNFTGVSDDYEQPDSADLILDTDKFSAEECASKVIDYVKKHLVK